MYRINKCYKNYRIAVLIISFFIIIFGSAEALFAADVFIDPSQNDPAEDGSFEHPYNSWWDVQLNSADDYFQKCGTTTTLGSYEVNVSGTENNYVVFGAYYENGGRPVIESDNPSYGEFCANGAPKPIIADSDHLGSVINLNGQYLELNSIQIKKGDTALYVRNSNNHIAYCRIGWSYWGIRMGLSGHTDGDYNYIGHNYIYTDTGALSTDGLQLGLKASYNLIEFNVLDGWDHTAITTNHNGSEYNEVRYNTILSWDDLNSECFTPNGFYNKFHHNYCKDAGDIQLVGGRFNEISYNIIDGLANNGTADHAIILLQPTNLSGVDVSDNKIYNNLIYDRRDGWPNPVGILLYSREDGGKCERNQIANNIVLNLNSIYQPFRVVDSYNKIDSGDGANSNKWMNNIAYGYTGTYYAKIETSPYRTAADMNSRSVSYDSNRDDDPGLSNPALGEFWPDDDNDSVVGNGIDLGELHQDMLDPDGTFIDQLPLILETAVQKPGNWNIGPYAVFDGTIIAQKPKAPISAPLGFQILGAQQ